MHVRCIVPDNFLSSYVVFPLRAVSFLFNGHLSPGFFEAVAAFHIHETMHASCNGRNILSFKWSYTGKNYLPTVADGCSTETLTFHVLDGVWGDQPAACVESHHAGGGGRAADQAHGRHFMAGLLQHLPVDVHREYLRLWAHTHQMQAHRGMGTHTDIWREGRKLLVTLCMLSLNSFVYAGHLVSVFKTDCTPHSLSQSTTYHKSVHIMSGGRSIQIIQLSKSSTNSKLIHQQ